MFLDNIKKILPYIFIIPMRLNLKQIGDRDTYARVCRYLIKVESVLVIPLILTIFTVVFTFEQKRLSIEQRTEDQQDAREERRQDREIAQEQRKHELYIQEENHRDVHLTTYINDIGQLLKGE